VGGVCGLGKLWNFNHRNSCNLMVETIIMGSSCAQISSEIKQIPFLIAQRICQTSNILGLGS
jgi:hypothetical protein